MTVLYEREIQRDREIEREKKKKRSCEENEAHCCARNGMANCYGIGKTVSRGRTTQPST